MFLPELWSFPKPSSSDRELSLPKEFLLSSFGLFACEFTESRVYILDILCSFVSLDKGSRADLFLELELSVCFKISIKIILQECFLKSRMKSVKYPPTASKREWHGWSAPLKYSPEAYLLLSEKGISQRWWCRL